VHVHYVCDIRQPASIGLPLSYFFSTDTKEGVMHHGVLQGSFGRISLATALLVCLAQAQAQAQNYQDYYGPGTAVQPPVSQVNHSLLADIEARLASLEAANGCGAEDSGCQVVDIQSKPNHQVIGRMFFDQLWMDNLRGAVFQPQENMTGFRDLRLGVQGNIWENLAYKAEFEFEGSEVDFKDVYAELQRLPWVGNFRIGHFREPMGLEHLTDARFLTFLERSAATKDFAPDRNLGIMAYNYFGSDNPNWSWYASLTRGNHEGDNLDTLVPFQGPPDEDVDEDTNDWSFTARIAGTPYYDEATPGRCLLHLGVGYSARRTGQNPGTLGNGLWLGDLEMDDRISLLKIQLNPREEFNVYNFEAAWVRGAFSLQGEYYYAETGGAAGIYANGAYLQASYFLTGENRGYDRRMKSFGRVYPYEPFFRVRTADGIASGLGAWEVAARWSWKDLESIQALFPGSTFPPTVIGTQENITLGANWYLNPYCRMMFNYIHSITDYTFIGKSEGDHFGIRFQIDW
jgi:phosphate-selective porin OprO/OprP